MPSYPARSSPFEDQQPGTNIRISADPSSARMPTYIGANAEPVLSLLYLYYSLLLSSIYILGTPPGIPFSPTEARHSSGIFAPD
jgi:hypothetical protein